MIWNYTERGVVVISDAVITVTNQNIWTQLLAGGRRARDDTDLLLQIVYFSSSIISRRFGVDKCRLTLDIVSVICDWVPLFLFQLAEIGVYDVITGVAVNSLSKLLHSLVIWAPLIYTHYRENNASKVGNNYNFSCGNAFIIKTIELIFRY